jgi:sporulation protein YlmC with PRC-barrel domain
MLTLGQSLINKSVLSLRNGSPIGVVTDVLIDPNNLKIEGWYAQDKFSKERKIILASEIRDIIPQGFVVDDDVALSASQDLVRLTPIIHLNFQLVDKLVISDTKRRMGKVTDYAFDKEAMFIQKLYVGQSVLKSFSGATLTIDRNQIVEVTNRKVVVKEALATDQSAVPAPLLAQ